MSPLTSVIKADVALLYCDTSVLALIVISPSAFEAVLITAPSPSIPKFSPPCTILTVLSSARNSTLPIALATISSALCRLNAVSYTHLTLPTNREV